MVLFSLGTKGSLQSRVETPPETKGFAAAPALDTEPLVLVGITNWDYGGGAFAAT